MALRRAELALHDALAQAIISSKPGNIRRIDAARVRYIAAEQAAVLANVRMNSSLEALLDAVASFMSLRREYFRARESEAEDDESVRAERRWATPVSRLMTRVRSLRD